MKSVHNKASARRSRVETMPGDRPSALLSGNVAKLERAAGLLAIELTPGNGAGINREVVTEVLAMLASVHGTLKHSVLTQLEDGQ